MTEYTAPQPQLPKPKKPRKSKGKGKNINNTPLPKLPSTAKVSASTAVEYCRAIGFNPYAKMADLAQNAKSENIQFAATNALLDRMDPKLMKMPEPKPGLELKAQKAKELLALPPDEQLRAFQELMKAYTGEKEP